MDNNLYTCQRCGTYFLPKRRGIQIYCSDSCRSRAYQLRQPKSEVIQNPKPEEPTQIEKMSMAGIGNNIAGTAIVKLAEHILTPEANKPATKGDLKNLESKLITKYYPIKNMNPNHLGQKPYFNVQLGLVEYY